MRSVETAVRDRASERQTSKQASEPSYAPDVSEDYPSASALRVIDARMLFFDTVRLVLRQRKTVLRWVVSGALLFTLVAFLIPAQYESTAVIMPPDQMNSSGLALISALSSKAGEGLGIAGDLLGMKSNGAMFMGILHSRTVQDDLINRFDLRKVYGYRYWEDARKKLSSRTDVSEDHKSGIITISVRDHDRQRADAIAQAYVDELNSLVAQLSTSSARRERIFLEGRLKEVQQDLTAASVEFSQFASKNTAIDITAQGKAMVESAATLQGQLIAAQSELNGLKQIYSDSNVRVRSLQARVEELQRQLNNVGGKDVGKEGSTAPGESLYPSIRELPLLGVKYSDLYRKLKIQEAVFEALTKQYELAKVQEAKELPTVKVLDSPVVPERKSFPPRLLLISFGVFLSFCLAVGWLMLRSRWSETTIDSPTRMFAAEISDHLRGAFKSLGSKRVSIR